MMTNELMIMINFRVDFEMTYGWMMIIIVGHDDDDERGERCRWELRDNKDDGESV